AEVALVTVPLVVRRGPRDDECLAVAGRERPAQHVPAHAVGVVAVLPVGAALAVERRADVDPLVAGRPGPVQEVVLLALPVGHAVRVLRRGRGDRHRSPAGRVDKAHGGPVGRPPPAIGHADRESGVLSAHPAAVYWRTRYRRIDGSRFSRSGSGIGGAGAG